MKHLFWITIATLALRPVAAQDEPKFVETEPAEFSRVKGDGFTSFLMEQGGISVFEDSPTTPNVVVSCPTTSADKNLETREAAAKAAKEAEDKKRAEEIDKFKNDEPPVDSKGVATGGALPIEQGLRNTLEGAGDKPSVGAVNPGTTTVAGVGVPEKKGTPPVTPPVPKKDTEEGGSILSWIGSGLKWTGNLMLDGLKGFVGLSTKGLNTPAGKTGAATLLGLLIGTFFTGGGIAAGVTLALLTYKAAEKFFATPKEEA